MSGQMTEDQKLLKDAAERYLRDSYDFNERRERIATGVYSDPAQWRAFAEMGWLALPIPEGLGGLGLGAREMAILAELCGQFLVTEPLIEAMAVSHTILRNSPQKEALLTQVAEGEMIPVAAIDEAGEGPRLSPATRLTGEAGQWRLTGSKHWIAAGASATHLAVLASSEKGLAWVLVPTDSEGVTRHIYPTHDGRGGASFDFDLTLDETQIIATNEIAQDALTAYRELAMVLSSAETLGATQAALDTTVDYTKQRVQFGQPLASFQALQHRMSNMLIQTELTRSLVYAACEAADTGHADCGRFARAAKVKAATVGRKVSQEAIQLHGGIATTDEYIVGHFFKRITALESWVCSKGEALQEFMAQPAAQH